MRPLLLLICLLGVSCPAAAEPKFPSSAKRVIDTIASEVLAAKQKAAKELRRVSIEIGKSGDLDTAERVKNEAIALEEEIKNNRPRTGGAANGPPGLIGTYQPGDHRQLNKNDWRSPADKDRQRRDLLIDFRDNAFGSDAERQLFGIEGNDNNWDRFGVQWDGVLRVFTAGTRLSTRSDDGSRVWLDLDRNGEIDVGEWGSNGWGHGNGNVLRGVQGPLTPGLYRIRIQYDEGRNRNGMVLLWDDAAHSAGELDDLFVVPSEALSAPNP